MPPPLPLQFSIATIAHAINERMARQFEYLQERFHQASGGQLIRPPASASNDNAMGNDIRCRSRRSGLLNFYHREAT